MDNIIYFIVIIFVVIAIYISVNRRENFMVNGYYQLSAGSQINYAKNKMIKDITSLFEYYNVKHWFYHRKNKFGKNIGINICVDYHDKHKLFKLFNRINQLGYWINNVGNKYHRYVIFPFPGMRMNYYDWYNSNYDFNYDYIDDKYPYITLFLCKNK